MSGAQPTTMWLPSNEASHKMVATDSVRLTDHNQDNQSVRLQLLKQYDNHRAEQKMNRST